MMHHPRLVARPTRRFLARGVSSALVLGALALAGTTGHLGAPAGPSVAGDVDTVASHARYSEPVRVATFNLLGANHTRHSSEFATYDLRMEQAMRLIAHRNFTLVGFQEFQGPQYDLFASTEGGAWAAYPGAELGNRIGQNSIGWRTDSWQLVEKHTYEIPYFHGAMVPEPYVKLRNRDSGLSLWVVNTHNPADSHGPAQRWRDQAIGIEDNLANQLRSTGVPVVFTGDFNDRQDAFCGITGRTTLHAVNGGSWSGGTCHPPTDMRIDWIFRSPALQAANYKVMDNNRVRFITDHKVVYSDISMPLG